MKKSLLTPVAPADKPQNNATAAIISLKKFTSQLGVSDVTTWRWRKKGWLECVNIAGKPYVSAEAIEKFKQRAAAGEFFKPPTGAAAASNKAA